MSERWTITVDRHGRHIFAAQPIPSLRERSVEVVPVAEVERLREALRGLLEVSGAVHSVVEGPNARWVDVPGEDFGYYEDDLVPAPDCVVCAAEKAAMEALLDA